MKPASTNINQQIEDLKKDGEHIKAAHLLMEVERYQEAGEIFERLFAFADALEAYEKGDFVRDAFRVILHSGSEEDLQRLVNRAVRTGDTEWVLEQLASKERYDISARVCRACGEIGTAASNFEKAGLLFDAAQAHLELGDLRQAGLLLEKHISKNQQDAQAFFYLGRILAAFAQYGDAVHNLQQAVLFHDDQDLMYDLCAPILIVCFSRLHYTRAAQVVLEKWRTSARGTRIVPSDVDAFLSSERAQLLSNTLTLAGSAQQEHESDHAANSVQHSEQTLFGGRYLLGESTRAGAVGQVFRAYDAFLGQSVALKVFSTQAAESTAFHRYAADVQSAGLLQNPSIPAVLEFNEKHGFLVTDWVDGLNLDAYCEQQADLNWLLPAVHSVLNVLSAAHRVGLIHGTVNTHAILVTQLRTYVVGFGEHHLSQIRSTETGGHQSRWPYMAPEQIIGHAVDVRSDLYGVGAMVYRALMGKPPPLQDAPNSKDLLGELQNEESRLGQQWIEFLVKALAREPSARFESCHAMGSSLPSEPPMAPAHHMTPEYDKKTTQFVEKDIQRYEKRALVRKEEGGLLVFEGWDTLLARSVWIVQVETHEELERLQKCASIAVGIQPVYDLRQSMMQCVLARDDNGALVDVDRLRFVPQSFLRDLARVANALSKVHSLGLALGAVSFERFLGPVGPRICLAPCALPIPLTQPAETKDWQGFEELVRRGFSLSSTDTMALREEIIQDLIHHHYLDLDRVGVLKDVVRPEVSWHEFLGQCSNTVVNTSSARLAGQILGQFVNDASRA